MDEQLQRLEEQVSQPIPLPFTSLSKEIETSRLNSCRTNIVGSSCPIPGKSTEKHPYPKLWHSIQVVGGAGLSTILATASRALSIRGKRVLLADDKTDSTLPLYFAWAVFRAD